MAALDRIGIYKDVDMKVFTNEEVEIVRRFSNQWFITTSKAVYVSKNRYVVFLMKPTHQYEEMFNLDREIIAVFSPYSSFDPRSIDVIDEAIYEFSLNIQNLRVEDICSVIISKDALIESKVNDLFMNNKESKVVVPFFYEELISDTSSYLIQNRFRKHFYNRDLFGFRSAIQKETYFFGRRDLVQELVNLHLSGECSGIFGLRKTGKTSIIYSIERTLKTKEFPSLFIDCQDTAVYKKRWNEVLQFIITRLSSKYGVKLKNETDDYSESKSSESFSRDIKSIYGKVGKKRILLMFDEIERISFKVSDEHHWRNSGDFIALWRTLRAIFQETKGVFTYMIAGTNAMCVEERSFNKTDNPLHNQVKSHYVPQFDVKQVSQMVNKLGGYMGLKFDDIVCANLTQDYGGHPFLIRQLCSVINDMIKDSDRPLVINRIEYEKAKPIFEQKYGNEYSAMILDVLQDYYEFEYLMLKHLAVGDIAYFKEHVLSSDSNFYTSHLIEYGVLLKKGDDFDFRIDTLKKYLIDKNKFNKKNLTNDEKLSEISARRNDLEPRLRKMVRNSMKAVFAEDEAKKKAIKYLHGGNVKFQNYQYKDLFNPDKDSSVEVYLSKIGDLMYSTWDDCFRNIFDKDKEKFKSRISIINELRSDAHAKTVKDYDMEMFRGAISWFEEKINEYESY